MRNLAAALAALVIIGARPPATQAQSGTAAPPVMLDASVNDKNGVVVDLRREDFRITDDGKRVEIEAITPVLARGIAGEGRDLLLILDDAGVPMAGTQAIQQIATMFATSAGPADAVTVIRLHTRTDETTRDRQTALARIAAFQAGSIPFFQNETTEDALQLITRVSREWIKSGVVRRRAIVCIGSPAVCSPDERDPTAPRDMYPNWVDAITETARANVVMYAAIPGRVTVTGGGLVERSGGEVFAGLTNFVPAVETVFRDLSQYYLIRYTPPASKKDMRTMSVRVNRRGVDVHARNKRGR